MAQTSQDVSFGPLFVVATFPKLSHIFKILIVPNLLVSINKTQMKKKKKTYKMVQTMHLASFGPVIVVVTFPK